MFKELSSIHNRVNEMLVETNFVVYDVTVSSMSNEVVVNMKSKNYSKGECLYLNMRVDHMIIGLGRSTIDLGTLNALGLDLLSEIEAAVISILIDARKVVE